ncbi:MULTISPECIES: ArsC/Spx/MgsR family protein [Pacificibacter]|uniref:ArsC/Spx/MgsR family protein n=1 Tax=Pacificibacter TaxID=1042323 RepID=UPI001C09A461|nr:MULTISPECIES: ArsC/Spx/MgsR family protein [Pacificibacter]MBU2935847.1 arsenate reductase [Pacificibacter marinus]MDO6614342.1 ArsC/Spx/MgsR family protein [Pacificibacter sp. 1_MG-2023]
MAIVYGIKTCDTCRKALKSLQATLHDVRVEPLSVVQLQRFQAEFGEALVNKKSTTWRGLDDVERARDPIELLTDHPTLMKRPVIDLDGKLYLGWGKDVQVACGI